MALTATQRENLSDHQLATAASFYELIKNENTVFLQSAKAGLILMRDQLNNEVGDAQVGTPSQQAKFDEYCVNLASIARVFRERQAAQFEERAYKRRRLNFR